MASLDELFDRGARGGDGEALAEFHRRAIGILVPLLDRPGGPRGLDADAAVADAVADACLDPSKVAEDKGVLPWLRAVAARKAVDWHRKGKASKRVPLPGANPGTDAAEGADGPPGHDPDPSAGPEWLDLLDALLRCAKRVLNEEQYDTFATLVNRGFDFEAVRKVLRITANALHVRVSRIRVQLREKCWYIVEGRRP